MSFMKFSHLMHSKALTFVSPALMPDQYEGFLGLGRQNQFILEQTGQLTDFLGQSGALGSTNDDSSDHDRVSKALSEIDENYIRARNRCLVSCWFAASYESEAMWSLYCPSNDGVLLVINRADLVRSLRPKDGSTIQEGNVVYQGFWTKEHPLENQDLLDIAVRRLFRKRLPFEHEREYRLVLKPSTGKKSSEFLPSAIDVQIDFGMWHGDDEFAAGVIVAHPNAEHWMVRHLRKVVARASCPIPVTQSRIRQPPASLASRAKVLFTRPRDE